MNLEIPPSGPLIGSTYSPMPNNVWYRRAFLDKVSMCKGGASNTDGEQAASRNADSASSLWEFLPSVGIGLVCIVVYGYESAHVRFTFGRN